MFFAHGCSEPATDANKPNEDHMAILTTESAVLAVIADGVTQPTDEDGNYPVEYGQMAARIAVDCAVGAFEDTTRTFDPEMIVREAVNAATVRVRGMNQQLGRWDVRDGLFRARIATAVIIACLAREEDGGVSGVVASLCDSVGLSVRMNGGVSVLSRDQMRACHDYSYVNFPPAHGESAEDSTRRRGAWQRLYARNNRNAVRPDDATAKIGFGVIDGNPHALYFLDARTIRLAPGDRLLLASDAIRVLQTNPANPDDPNGFDAVTRIVRTHSPEEAVDQIIHTIRSQEAALQRRSDDATVIVLGPA
jgi:serine/threonine protein phosphatase PrpC